MTFTQVDDTLMDSPAFLTVTRSARLLLMEAYTYCNRHLTDGFITRAQWLRSTDSEDFAAELDALVDADVVRPEDAGYRLDWSKQQTREQVLRTRERKRADNERRAKSLELHRAGDHSLCTHEGGKLHKPGRSSGRSTSTSSGQKGTMDGPRDGHAGGSPSHPIPSHNGVEGGMGGSALDGLDSAGAPSALGAGAAVTPHSRTWTWEGRTITSDMLPAGLDLTDVTAEQAAWMLDFVSNPEPALADGHE